MIRCSAVIFELTKNGKQVVVAGVRHADCFETMRNLGFVNVKDYKVVQQGFLKDDGQFLNRYEAYNYAVTNNLLPKAKSTLNALFSEDLW